MILKDPIENTRALKLNISILCIFFILVASGYYFGGLDFAKATLLGCVVVAINFFILQRLVAQLIGQKAVQVRWIFIYFFKLIISGVILFIAVIRLDMNPIGLMFGLSSIFFASVVSMFFRNDASNTEVEKV